MAAKKTVLVLHGYSQNASILSKRLGALRRECAKDLDLVFIDAPHIMKPADLANLASIHPSIESQQSQVQNNIEDPSEQPRAWWIANHDRTQAVGLEESIISIKNILMERKFDGVFGFSQGAAFAAFIAALLERPHLYPPFLVDGKPPHSPLEFCVAVSGFKIYDPIAHSLLDPSFTTRTLHVIGKTDVIVVEERSKVLIDLSANKRVEEHEGGHYVPFKGNWRKFLANFMRDPLAPLPSPRLSGGSSTPTDSGRGSEEPNRL